MYNILHVILMYFSPYINSKWWFHINNNTDNYNYNNLYITWNIGLNYIKYIVH